AARSASRSALAAPATMKPVSWAPRSMSSQRAVGTRLPSLPRKNAVCSANGRRNTPCSTEGWGRLAIRLLNVVAPGRLGGQQGGGQVLAQRRIRQLWLGGQQ